MSRWYLVVKENGHTIKIMTTKKYYHEYVYLDTVYPPSIIEKLFGITFNRKFEKAMKNAQLKIDEYNSCMDDIVKMENIKELI